MEERPGIMARWRDYGVAVGLALVLWTLIAVVVWSVVAGEASAQPNIIVILADDMGAGDLSSPARTPNLDALAEQGTRFTQAYATQICSTTRAMLHTGAWPWKWGVTSHLSNHARNAERGMVDYLDPAAPSLPRALQEAGYYTVHVGKFHMGHTTDAPPVTDYGYDEALQVYWGRVSPVPEPRQSRGSLALERRQSEANGALLDTKSDPYWRARSTAKMVSAALRVLKDHPTQPVFINLSLVVPHSILRPTPYMLRAYSSDRPAAPGHYGANVVYWSTLTYSIDLPIGRLLRGLDDLGIADDTIVIFTSDNGPESPHRQHSSHAAAGRCDGRGFKRSLYECGTLTPLIVRWPGRVPSRVSDAVVSLVDFYPTLAALAGAQAPVDPDGEDMSDVWLGADRARRTPLLWRQFDDQDMANKLHQSPPLAVRDGPWKLLTDPESLSPELYYIPSDRMEVDNRATDRPEVVTRLEGLLR